MWGKKGKEERKREMYLIMLKIWEKLGEIVVKNTLPKMVKLYLKIKNCFCSKKCWNLLSCGDRKTTFEHFWNLGDIQRFKEHIFVQVTHEIWQW